MNVVIFLGPSLPVAEARQILDATYLPPAKQADFLSAIATYRPDVIGLVDGEFGQSLSVWHKEILYALSEGIAVYGGSSMGALRAVETAAYGTIGIGQVYGMYASGEINDDDEVALAHGLDDSGYRAFSLPMVNIRATLKRAHAAGALDGEMHARLIRLAKALYFPERTWTRILRDAAMEGVGEARCSELRVYLTENYHDIKREDAVHLLETIRDLRDVPRPEPFEFNRSHLFDTLYNRDRRVRHQETDVPLAAIANYAALHHPQYNAVNQNALNRGLGLVLAEILEVEVGEAEIADETARFKLSRRLPDDEALAEWARRNDLTDAEFRQLMREQAELRVLHRWLATRKFMERTTRIVLDELRLRGEYEQMAKQTAEQERVLEHNFQLFKETSYHDLRTASIVVDHMRATPCRMDTHYRTWAEDAGFHSSADMRIELLRSRLAREFRQQLATELLAGLPAAPGPEQVNGG